MKTIKSQILLVVQIIIQQSMSKIDLLIQILIQIGSDNFFSKLFSNHPFSHF